MTEEKILVLPGIGPKKTEMFAKLGVTTVGELLQLYPRAYEDRTRLVPISALEVDCPACFMASVVRDPQTHRIPKEGNRMLTLTKVVVADHTGRLNLTFFNAPYAAQQLRRGETYCFYGSVTGDYLGYAMTNPLFEPLNAAGTVTRCIVPIYPLTAGLTNKAVQQAVRAALARYEEVEILPPDIRARYDLCGRGEALRQIHAPADAARLDRARRRLAFEEYFRFSLALSLVRAQRQRRTTEPYQTDAAAFFTALPFALTGAQRRAVDEIFTDLASGVPMSRLVQGDVGSGKTMVAAAAAYCAAKNGRQVAFLAPTEILARQHYERLAPLFAELGVTCILLTGSLPERKKSEVRRVIESGGAQLVIGTHALLTDSTNFARLGLVIADEQQRFGVAQRAALLKKGRDLPHLLLLSATPIPRTLALILYGDLEVSIIDELPPGRQPVESFLVDERYRKRLNGFIRKQAEEGHQTFIVCPAIEEGETGSLKAAEAWAQTLREQVFPTLRVALLHGKLRGAEKEAVMQAFAEGEYDILVATTVIEVGVDVPNATLMVVENAERFGLSQLHQLRGRIGRGAARSYCILVSDEQNAETRKRLKALCATADGFRIAEEDLKLRGPGDFFGERQSGLPLARAGALSGDLSLLKAAQQAAAEVVSADVPLPEALANELAALSAQGETLN